MSTIDKKRGIVTPVGRLVWPSVFEPKRNPNFPEIAPRFECSILFEAGTDLSQLKAAATDAARDLPDGHRSPFRTEDLGKLGPEFEGGTLISTWAKTAPGVVDLDRKDIEPISGEIYSGCYGRLSLDCYAYTKGAGGVNFGLLHVQKTNDGNSLGGRVRVKAEDAFDDAGDLL